MKQTTRVRAGLYQYTVNGRRFVIVANERDGGGIIWHCCEQTGPTPFHHGPPFDAAATLSEAKDWCDTAAQEL